MKNRVIIILVACLMACSVIGICFATYYVNAQKSIVISTGNSKTLTINAEKEGEALSPEHPVTYNVELDVDVPGDYDAYAGLQGKFYITVNTTNALTAATTITMMDGGLTPYDRSDMEEGIFYNLEDLPQILVITFSVEDFNMTIAEQQIQITMHWDFVEWAPTDASTYLLGTYGNLENVWAPTYECTTLGADPDGENHAEIEGLALEAGDIIKLYVQGWSDASWISWKTDAASLGNWAEYDVNGNLVIKEAGTYNIYLSTSGGNGAYVTKAN